MGAVHVLALAVDLRIPDAHSLKDRRQAVKPLVEGARHRFGVSAAEVGAQESWQRAQLGFAVVASSPGGAERVIADVEAFLWDRPDIEVIATRATWLDDPDG